jgi:hypothetical protein
MSISLIKILSCSIFIAELQNKKNLAILLKDYAKSRVTSQQFIFILLLTILYKKNNIFVNDNFYKILYRYIHLYEKELCRQLIFI